MHINNSFVSVSYDITPMTIFLLMILNVVGLCCLEYSYKLINELIKLDYP